MTFAYGKLQAALDQNPIVPVMTIKTLKDAMPMAKRLKEDGFTVLEITLRSAPALDAIKILKEEFPDLVIGAGTIVTPQDIDAAISAGSDFLVTPATPISLAERLINCPVPVLPGCATATEAQTLYNMGFEILKLFPAETSGGAKALKSLSAPLPHLKFMPTGGITEEKSRDYLALPNVIAVGGSWMTKN